MAVWVPLDTDLHRRRFPYGTWSLLALMAGIYVVILLLHLPYEAALEYGIVPEQPRPIGLLAALFLHASGVHLLFNALLLWFFGRDVEDRLGSAAYLLLYFAGGLAANLAQIGAVRLFSPTDQDIPIIGASGAIAVVMGAFAAFFPHARIVRSSHAARDERRHPAGLPAAWVWGIWLVVQVLAIAWHLMGGQPEAGIWGHAAGFVLGAGAAMALQRGRGSEADLPADGDQEAEWREAQRYARRASERSEDPQALLGAAAVSESLGEPEIARLTVEKALALALERRFAPLALSAYRWLTEREALFAVPYDRRLEVAALLQNEDEPEGALEVLEPLAREAPAETAASALLIVARILAGPMQDPTRADEALRLIEGRYSQTRAAALAAAERMRRRSSAGR